MTFRQSLTAFGDHVLDKALKPVEAGACFPSNGKFCACYLTAHCPNPPGQWFIYSCLGQCNKTYTTCC